MSPISASSDALVERLLPPEEWGRLSETDIPQVLAFTKPEDIQVCVVERAGRIVAAWAVLRVVHLEGVWIAPEYRKRGTVAGRLLALTLRVARAWAPWAITGAQTDEVAHLLTKHLHAVRLPIDTYLVPLEDRECR